VSILTKRIEATKNHDIGKFTRYLTKLSNTRTRIHHNTIYIDTSDKFHKICSMQNSVQLQSYQAHLPLWSALLCRSFFDCRLRVP
jgi:hypothetical protein